MRIVDLITQEFSPAWSQAQVAERLGYQGKSQEFYFVHLSQIETRYLTFLDNLGPHTPETYQQLIADEVTRLVDCLCKRLIERHRDIIPRIRSITTINSQVQLIPTPAEQFACYDGFSHKIDLCHIHGTNCASAFQPIRMILDGERLGLYETDEYHMVVSIELPSITIRKARDPDQLDFLAHDIIVSDGAFLLLVAPDEAPTHHPAPRISGVSSYLDTSFARAADCCFDGSLPQYRLDMDFIFHFEELVRSAYANALNQFGIQHEDVKEFIVHPGAVPVLDVASHALGIERKRLVHCYDTIRKGGNRQSSLIWYALERYMSHRVIGDGRGPSIAIGFGPGACVETMLLT